MSDKTDKTSAMETLRAARTTRYGYDYFAMGEEEYLALLDRVIDAPTDADGNVLHVGDKVTCWAFDGASVTSFRLFTGHTWEARFEGCEGWKCSGLHKVMPDSRERIEQDAKLSLAEYCDKRNIYGLTDCNTKPLDLVRRCFALVDGEGR